VPPPVDQRIDGGLATPLGAETGSQRTSQPWLDLVEEIVEPRIVGFAPQVSTSNR
jgi:hypothetical protein